MADKNCTTYSIYRIVCFQTGKCYVGQTVDVRDRRQKHFRDLRKGTHHNHYLQRAYNKYGKDAFYFEVVESGVSEADADECETKWIAHFDSYRNGFNMTEDGVVASGSIRKPCSWNGIKYPSVAAAVRAHGRSIRAHLAKGYTSDSDVVRYKRPCEWEGVQYESVAAAARAADCATTTMQHYIESGYKTRADIKRPSDAAAAPCTWNGIEYASYSEAARANNVEPGVMGDRIHRGRTCDSDLHSTRGKPCTWNGIEYPTVTAAAAANGVNAMTMLYRIKRGYTCDDDMKRIKRHA